LYPRSSSVSSGVPKLNFSVMNHLFQGVEPSDSRVSVRSIAMMLQHLRPGYDYGSVVLRSNAAVMVPGSTTTRSCARRSEARLTPGRGTGHSCAQRLHRYVRVSVGPVTTSTLLVPHEGHEVGF
jgi:hypothetical protein